MVRLGSKLAICSCLLFTLAVAAQSFLGSITGTVLDPSGAAIPQATVLAKEIKTGAEHTITTGGTGQYSFPDLPPGTYSLVISATGFKNVQSSEIVLTAQQVQRFDVSLQVGNSSEKIDVASSATTINTENAEVDGVVSHKELQQIPLNERSTFSFLALNSFNIQGADHNSYSIGGLRGVNTNFTVDGVTSNASLFGGQSGPQTEESFEAVREVKLMASNNSAEFANVATVVVESRSGENQMHGSAFFYTENNAFNARGFFAGPNAPGPIRHQFGASFGGPVVIPKLYDGHNKTFFYFTWEQLNNPGGFTGTANVPTAAMRGGDFSSLLSQHISISDPATGLAYPGNRIPASQLSPVSLNIQKFLFPMPNVGPADSYTNNWVGFFPSSSYDNRYVTRLDHIFSEKDSLSGRLSIRDIPQPRSAWGYFPDDYYNEYRRTFNGYISETHIFTPTLLNEARIGFSRDHASVTTPFDGGSLIKQFGIEGVNTTSGLSGVPAINFNNFSGLTDIWQEFYMSQTLEALDNVTLTKGRHTIKAGALFRYNTPAQSNQPANSTDYGSYTFTSFATGFDYSDFLLGIPQQTSLAYRAPNSYLRYLNTGLFVQDDFHVTPRLTVNLGLRWEYNQPPVDKNDFRFSFNPANGNIVVPTQTQLSQVSTYFPSNVPIETAAQAGFPGRSLLQSNWHDFAPRISFAYRPSGSDRFVIRGGYGLFYSPLVSTAIANFQGGPFASSVNFTNAINNGSPAFAFPNPFGGSSSIPSQSISAVNPHIRTPYVQQWNFTMEQDFTKGFVGRLAYRGFRSNELPYIRDLNSPFPSSNPDYQNVFRYPNFYQVNYTEDGGIQKMNALDAALERKLTSGFTFQSQYTWAKNMSDAGDDYESNAVMNPYNRSVDMGNVSYNPEHRWVTSGLYELPIGTGKAFGSNWNPIVRQIVGGWQISGAFVWQTGQFLTPTFNSVDTTNNRSILTGLNRPDCLSNPNLPNPSINRWFDNTVFAVPAQGQYGNCGRGIIVGPGIVNLDLGLMKNFKLSERVNFQLRGTATNSLNHPIFNNPGSFPNVEVIDSTNSNQLTGSLGQTQNRGSLGQGYRIIEVGARFDF